MMRVRVIGAGFGRTGTFSLKAALEQLGYGPCYHMSELFRQPDRAPLWEAAARGEPGDWDELLRGYAATVDWPGSAFYAELMEKYPDAPVILTLRDPESWYESVTNTIRRSPRPHPAGVDANPVSRANRSIIWQGIFEGAFEDRGRTISLYKQHVDEVVDRVPRDRLLLFQPAEGWEPLCRSLGVDVPVGRAFPHLNEGRAFRRASERARKLGSGSARGEANERR